MFPLDERGGLDQILPRRRAVGHSDFRPDALQVVARVGDIVVAEAEPLARHRIVGAALAEIDDGPVLPLGLLQDRKSTRLNSSHGYISYAVFCLKKKNKYT